MLPQDSRINILITILSIFTILFFLGSVGFFVKEYSTFQARYVIANVQNIPSNPHINAEVLGTAVSCPPIEEDLILSVIPKVKVQVADKSYDIESSRVRSCFSIPNICHDGVVCGSVPVRVDKNCLKDLVIGAIPNFQETVDIPGVNGPTVKARKTDWVLNVDHLISTMITQYTNNVSYCDLRDGSKAQKTIIIHAPLDTSTPNTDGSVAPRYIEVDGSRQLMFLWNGGKYEKFDISGAFEEYNPIGVHRILNKSTNAWSSTANKWMPYWMAITYDKKQKTMLGIHSLVYWYPGFEKTGEFRYEEPESNIGTPRSTGCLRLTKENAKYVYERTQVGDLVVVHE